MNIRASEGSSVTVGNQGNAYGLASDFSTATNTSVTTSNKATMPVGESKRHSDGSWFKIFNGKAKYTKKDEIDITNY